MEILGTELQILAAGAQLKFNETVSFTISCKDQAEVDYYWKALTAKGGSEGPCGWLKDKYGLSWQIVPEILNKLHQHKDKTKGEFAMNAVMRMKKIIIADLQKKYLCQKYLYTLIFRVQQKKHLTFTNQFLTPNFPRR